MMTDYLGIDLGTSSVKVVLVDETGAERARAQVHYEVHRPHPGWAEQDPESWWRATVEAIGAVLAETRAAAGRAAEVAAIGLSGQMHGLVLLDAAGALLRPAIIWSDSRASAQVAAWQAAVDPAAVERASGFPIAAGMTGTSLSWVRDEEPEVYARAHALLLPKDYIRFRLTGVLATEPTDAGGSLLYDIHAGRPAYEVFERIGLREDLLPPVVATLAVAGAVTAVAAAATGLDVGTPVAAGGGDQSMAAIALGLGDTRRAAVAISSGGTVFKRTPTPLEPDRGLHVLPHAFAEQWLAMGVVLSAGLSIDWLARHMFGGSASPEHVTRLMSEAAAVEPGAEGLLFSSQLGGTRTPETDPEVRGSLIGLGYRHGQQHITRAMVEGVCIALARALDAMGEADEPVSELVITGGAARFGLWRQTLSDVTGLPVRVSTDLEHSAIGSALGSAIAIGRPVEIDPGARLGETILPDRSAAALYRDLALHHHSVDRAITALRERRAAAGPHAVVGDLAPTERAERSA